MNYLYRPLASRIVLRVCGNRLRLLVAARSTQNRSQLPGQWVAAAAVNLCVNVDPRPVLTSCDHVMRCSLGFALM